MKRGRLILLSLMVWLTGCGIQPNQLVNPSDLLDDVLQQSSTEVGEGKEEGIFLLTEDRDLFYLDPTLRQYKLSNQVDYFDYDEATNTIKIQKMDERWVVWFLDNKKPLLIPAASELKVISQQRGVLYKDDSTDVLYLLKDDASIPLVNRRIKVFEPLSGTSLTLVISEESTMTLLTDQGDTVQEYEQVIAYQYNPTTQILLVWGESDACVVKIDESMVHHVESLTTVADWMMFPIYSRNLQTKLTFEAFDLERGVGTLVVHSVYHGDPIRIPMISTVFMNSDGTAVYYLNDKNTLYHLDLQTNHETMLGLTNGTWSYDQQLDRVIYKYEDNIYTVDEKQKAQRIASDVYQYEDFNQYFVYTNSIQDLYLNDQGVDYKIDEGVQSFALTANGVYYSKDNQLIYKNFKKSKEVILDQESYYQSVFLKNTELYRKTLAIAEVDGYFKVTSSLEESLIYHFDASGLVEVWKSNDDEQSYVKGYYSLLHGSGTTLNLVIHYEDETERYVSLSGLGDQNLKMIDLGESIELIRLTQQEIDEISLLNK